MKKFIPFVIVAVVVGFCGFYGGMKYVEGKGLPQVAGVSTRAGIRGLMGMGNFGGMMGQENYGTSGRNMMGGFAGGEILSKDDKSVTVKLRDGGSKIVFISGATKISKFVDGTTDDLIIGKNIMVNGKVNSDGSITATGIQLRPDLVPEATAKSPSVTQ